MSEKSDGNMYLGALLRISLAPGFAWRGADLLYSFFAKSMLFLKNSA